MNISPFEQRRAQQMIKRRLAELRATCDVVTVADLEVVCVINVNGEQVTVDPLGLIKRARREGCLGDIEVVVTS